MCVQELKQKHVVEEGDHYTQFTVEIKQLSEAHEEELESMQSMTITCELNRRLHQTLHRLGNNNSLMHMSECLTLQTNICTCLQSLDNVSLNMFSFVSLSEDEENELQSSQESRIIAMFVKHESERKELKKLQKVEVEKHLSEDSLMRRLKERRRQLNRDLAKLTSKPEVLPCPECPVCYESMKVIRQFL